MGVGGVGGADVTRRTPNPRCSLCNGAHVDASWVAAFPSPGPKAIAIGQARHHLTALSAMRRAMLDDDGVWRCITCLGVVDPSKVTPSSVGDYGRIAVMGFATGCELMCCGRVPETK